MNKSSSRSGIGHCGLWMFGLLLTGGAVYLLLPVMRPQIVSALPFLVLLLCPLMHLFMHNGHERQRQETNPKDKPGR